MAVPASIAGRLPSGRYSWWVGKGMDRAYRRAVRRPTAARRTIDVKDLKAVVFSDHHRGTGDGADDFRRCEEAYAGALGWYLERGHELWLLGDVEELWMNRPNAVMSYYRRILDLESRFGTKRLFRFYGNHDLTWRNEHTASVYLPGQTVHEAMRVKVTDGGRPLGELFLVHGHQGTVDSGNLLILPISRFVVRFIWGTLQRWRGYPNTSPAEDARLRHRHDQAMAVWADEHRERLVLIAGHTHHPVFLNSDPPDLARAAQELDDAYDRAKAAGEDAAAERAARELAAIRAHRDQPYDPPNLNGWSYFNTGCCSFADGDITGLEIEDGEIRLVRWSGNTDHPEPSILQRQPLTDVFSTLSGADPAREIWTRGVRDRISASTRERFSASARLSRGGPSRSR